MELKLDDTSLDEVANVLKQYCQKQRSVMSEYLFDIRYLRDSWEGPQFDNLLFDVERLTDLTESTVDDIGNRYGTYYRNKAEMIRNRPSFSGKGGSNGTSSSGGSSSESSSGKSFFDKVFEGYNKEITAKIYTYLRRIRIYKPNDRICFYDPNGRSKRGLYKNIMAIDINSPTFKQDMLLLTGQHIFFQLQHAQKMQLIRCLGNEINNKAFLNDTAYEKLTNGIKSGSGIETKYLSFESDDARMTFNFFARAFQATVSNNENEINMYKKYYSNSYGNFVEILKNMSSCK